MDEVGNQMLSVEMSIERLIDNDKVEVLISDNVKVEVVRSTGIQNLLNNTDQKK